MMRFSVRRPAMFVVLAMGMAAAGVVAAERHPGELKGLKSINSGLDTTITFVNRTSQPVKIHWLDYDGKRKPYETLPPGQQCDQPTYVGHPWLVTDAQDRPWGLYYPDAQPRTVEISAPRPRGVTGGGTVRSRSGEPAP
jgi:von Hippel-Lindau disease tumor supressor